MRRSVLVLAFLAVLLHPLIGAAAEEPLPGRIGGDRKSFEKRYGEPSVAIEAFEKGAKTAFFAPEDYSIIEAFFHKGYLVWVSVISPRAEDKSLTRADDADWTVEEARKVATGFLPRDAKIDQETTESDEGDLVLTAHSEALEKRFSAATYAQYKAKGEQGDLRVELLLTKAGDVSSVVVSLGNEDAGVTVPEPKPDESATGDTAEEAEYLRQVNDLVGAFNDSYVRVAELFGRPQSDDPEWTADLATELTLWQDTYQEMQHLDPPPRFAEFHATTLEALALFDEAATDITVGLDHPNLENPDFDRVSLGLEKIIRATAPMEAAMRLLDELNEERGG